MDNNKCLSTMHNFLTLNNKNYYKGGLPDRSVAYTIIFCSKCGETREVVSMDHRETK